MNGLDWRGMPCVIVCTGHHESSIMPHRTGLTEAGDSLNFLLPITTMPRQLKWILVLLALAVFAIAAGAVLLVEMAGVPPRVLAPYIERRASGHNAIITGLGQAIGAQLRASDRGLDAGNIPVFTAIGARLNGNPSPGGNASLVMVRSVDDAIQAITRAQPGDVITFFPGTYRFEGRRIVAAATGSENRRIVVRAEKPGTVFIEFNLSEGFTVTAPYWTFENLHIRGVCREHADCEHAFHVVGAAKHFEARNNVISDFNAHIKVNGFNNEMPDYGIVEFNTFSNTSVRRTSNPVTPIDVVAASYWTIRRNLIRDFIKGEGDRISYGAFVKGGGSDNILERNVVLCEADLKGSSGQRVGLSLGGGGTEKQFCRDRRCIVEQDHSTIQSNLIAHCSDDGIYVNRSASSKLVHNTLIDTAGINVRFPTSSADVVGNAVDGIIRSANDALMRTDDNRQVALLKLYLGMHPERDLYLNAASLNLVWAAEPQRRQTLEPVPDLCQASRPKLLTYGAFEDFAACVR